MDEARCSAFVDDSGLAEACGRAGTGKRNERQGQGCSNSERTLVTMKGFWKKLPAFVAGGTAALLITAGTARADDNDVLKELKARLERLEKQNDELRQKLETQPVVPAAAASAEPNADQVRTIVAEYLTGQEEKKKQEEADKGHAVGSDLKMSARWNPNNGVTFETPNKDFVSHIGFRFQLDTVAFDQDSRLRAPTPAGIGDLQDGVFFRRVRPSWDGTAYEVFEWNCELLLEALAHNVIGLDDVWAGVQKLPLVGTVRIGHFHLAQGLEGDMYGSSKNMTFLERSMYTDAFEQNLGTGVWVTNTLLDQRATWAFNAYRQDNYNGDNWGGNNGVSFGDGKGAFIGRVTALPLYENDGRCLLHVGLSGSWRKAEDVNESTGLPGGPSSPQGQTVGPTFVQFRARPQLRDGIGDYGSGSAGPGLPGNANRLVDTGVMTASSSGVVSPELFFVNGPFSLQAEYAWAVSNSTITTAATNVVPGTKVGTHLGDVWFNGGYIQASYFLTGENRIYDRRLGRLAAPYIASPYTPFYLTRGENGNWLWGRGAWEIAARWNHLNLNSGRINGGESDALEIGLNWYLSNNLKIQFEYLHQDRYDMKKGVNPGDLDGLGIRTQFFF
jgi:phosphate-selective porin OprO/OprP